MYWKLLWNIPLYSEFSTSGLNSDSARSLLLVLLSLHSSTSRLSWHQSVGFERKSGQPLIQLSQFQEEAELWVFCFLNWTRWYALMRKAGFLQYLSLSGSSSVFQERAQHRDRGLSKRRAFGKTYGRVRLHWTLWWWLKDCDRILLWQCGRSLPTNPENGYFDILNSLF